ncbi:hypothetical protein HPB48_016263 [Haemaphysalis longicornis]|uniref:Transposable element P transposase-like RNase H domain-containing protein n=1 Tax=Haemaphysalis longicornis TaxID=44386 RepID=A0A9J6GC54_HAELO|nr:hypothetical protein HPB48_016263 [Haemaphysalis longicornis]
MNLLSLSTSSWLKQIIKGMPCEFGFNKVLLASIGAFMKQEQSVRCYGTLILDEMGVRRTVKFNKQTYKVDGFVDYGDYQESTTVVDRALFLMLVLLFLLWVQPIASFATKNAAPGRVLASMVLEAVIQLHKQNAMVVAVIVMKQVQTRACSQPLASRARFTRLCTKLNTHAFQTKVCTSVIFPTSSSVLGTTSFVTSTVCRSTAVSFKLYKRLQHPGLQNCDGTVEPTTLANDVFDALNVKLPQFAIRSSPKETEVITEFVCLVNLTEQNHNTRRTAMFASKVTIESLRVTLNSSDLLSEGPDYILTGKLNQDPLEVLNEEAF